MIDYPQYALAVTQGYRLHLANIGVNVYDDAALAIKEDFKDIIITRPNYPSELELLDTHALMTVQGYVYPTVQDMGNVYIKGAVESMLKTKLWDVGIIDFSNVPEGIRRHQISKEMLSVTDRYFMSERVNIKLPKPVDGGFLVLAGYIIPENPRYLQRVSDQEFILYPKRLNLVNKLYELERYIDLFKKLDIEISEHNPSVMKGEDLLSNETIMKLLSMDNTMFVEVPNHKVSFSVSPLNHTTVAGIYQCDELPNKPLLGGRGKVIEYKRRDMNREKYTILTSDSYYNNLLLDFDDESLVELFYDHRNVGRTYRLSPGFFLTMKLTRYKEQP